MVKVHLDTLILIRTSLIQGSLKYCYFLMGYIVTEFCINIKFLLKCRFTGIKDKRNQLNHIKILM